MFVSDDNLTNFFGPIKKLGRVICYVSFFFLFVIAVVVINMQTCGTDIKHFFRSIHKVHTCKNVVTQV